MEVNCFTATLPRGLELKSMYERFLDFIEKRKQVLNFKRELGKSVFNIIKVSTTKEYTV